MYNIVIRAIASRASGDTGPAETVDTTVTVTVTDVDEDGEVVISWLQPEVGIAITASLTDPDGDVTPTWAWTVSEVKKPPLNIDTDQHWGTAPGDGVSTETYTPDADDEGKYLRVTASYTVGGDDKTARMMSANPVQAMDGGRENGSPDFVDEKVDRSVAETAAVGADVGAPVTAPTGGSSAKDTLTYGLRAFATGDVGSTSLEEPVSEVATFDLAAFAIDQASGQITVARKLNFERGKDTNDPSTANDGKYVVVATVTDPSNLFDNIVVVITADDMNEDPVLSGRPELTIDEIDSGAEDAESPDFDGQPEQDPVVPTVNVYNVVDEDSRAGTQSWDLKGEDAGEFQLIGTVGRTLVFRNQPDYENPADANGDNVYKVTVVTFDGHDGRGEFDVCIAVMNINEAGKITLFDEDGVELVQPRAHGPITAKLTDPDGGVTGLEWQWARSQLDPPVAPDPADIADATSPTYRPTNDDTSYFLMVTATYMDARSEVGDDARTAVVTATYAVLEVEDDKGRAPAFPQDAIEVEVAENSPSTTYVGEAIVGAVDPERTTLTYSLVGDDAAYFELATNTRQIVVGHPTVLDKEDDKKNTYTVGLQASDGALSDTLMVTITVTDRNEAPSMPMATKDAPAPDPTPANNAPVFPAATDTREVAENTATGTDIGAPVMATDADNDTLTYMLGGADMASFDIDGATGQLMTKDPLDYETKASYTVTVTASDGNMADDATIAVTITVTNVVEPGDPDEPVIAGDTDGNGMISKAEVITAFRAYVAGQYTKAQIIAIFRQYVADAASSQ